MLYRLLGAPEPAEEVAQDAFHVVWRRLARTAPIAAPSGPGCSRSRATPPSIGAGPRASASRARPRSTKQPSFVEETRVDDRVIASLRAERVREAVASLPEEQHTVLSLAFWSGLSQAEIAERTGTPLGTVKSRVRLGRTKLRDRLELEAEGV